MFGTFSQTLISKYPSRAMIQTHKLRVNIETIARNESEL